MQAMNLDTGQLLKTPLSGKIKRFWLDADNEEEMSKLPVLQEHVAIMKKHRFTSYIEFPEYTGIVLFELHYKDHRIIRRPFIFFFDEKRILSLAARDEFERFYQNVVVQKKARRIKRERIIFELLGQTIRKNSQIALEIEREIGRMEERVGESRELNVKQAIAIRRVLLRLSRHYLTQRELIFEFKENRINLLEPSEEFNHRLADLYNALFFDINLNEQLHAILADVRELYMSTISNRINDSIKRLTIVTVLFTIVSTISVFPNTIATIFGVPYLPLQTNNPIELYGISLLPWQIIAFILLASTLVPAWLLYRWWKRNYQNWG